MLNILNPRIIVVGEAPSEHLYYYSEYNTITQNTAGHIVFQCIRHKIHVFTSKKYEVGFLDHEYVNPISGVNYIGTLNLS